MTRSANLNRRADLEAALKRAGARDVLSLQDLADLYGTSKSNFTNILRQIERMFEMPPYTIGPRGIHVYPAKKAIRVLIAYETRNDRQAKSIQERTARILGKGRRAPTVEGALPLSEMAIAARLAAEAEQRERDQGLYCPLSDQAVIAGDVFAMFSGFLGELDTRIDPHGLLSPEVHELIKKQARLVGMQFHEEMKEMLSGHAIPKSERPSGARVPVRRSGRAQARRPGGKRMAR